MSAKDGILDCSWFPRRVIGGASDRAMKRVMSCLILPHPSQYRTQCRAPDVGLPRAALEGRLWPDSIGLCSAASYRSRRHLPDRMKHVCMCSLRTSGVSKSGRDGWAHDRKDWVGACVGGGRTAVSFCSLGDVAFIELSSSSTAISIPAQAMARSRDTSLSL